MNKTVACILLVVCFLPGLFFPQAKTGFNSVKKIIIVAGQSNALNLHADYSYLKPDSNDINIPFYFHSGAPPNNGYAEPFIASSKGEWQVLKYQTQNPYLFLKKDFFGPEISIARNIYNSGFHIAVIKSAFFGTNLAKDWGKGITSGNKLYNILIKQIDTALLKLRESGYDAEICGFFWMQGESDADNLTYANNYKANLVKFISDLRTDLKNSALPFILGRIGNKSSYPYKEIVRTAQVEVASTVNNVGWIDTDDLPMDTDKIHYLAEGVYKLGERMAAAWLLLQPNEVKKEQSTGLFLLKQNYPNPFNPETIISFNMAEKGFVKLVIYNLLGQRIAEPAAGFYERGEYNIKFSAKNVAGGVYIYNLSVFSEKKNSVFSSSKRMLLLK